jgi:hypothetical protein
MPIVPPDRNPLNYPRDPSRSVGRDALIFFATLAAIGLMFAFAYLVAGVGFKTWGLGYAIGFLVGGAVMMVYVRVMHGHWP